MEGEIEQNPQVSTSTTCEGTNKMTKLVHDEVLGTHIGFRYITRKINMVRTKADGID